MKDRLFLWVFSELCQKTSMADYCIVMNVERYVLNLTVEDEASMSVFFLRVFL